MHIFALGISLVILVIAPASAHVSVQSGLSFAAGVQHPFSGGDHLAAMVAIGLWAALIGGNRIYFWPLAFMLAMLGGGFLAHEGIYIPYTDLAAAASVLILGLAITALLNAPAPIGAAVIACFGIAHGYAHGIEAPQTGWAGY